VSTPTFTSAAETIRKKRDGERLSDAEIRAFISAYSDDALPDYQAAALLMAVYFRGLDAAELATWTDAMLRSGTVLDLADIPGFKVDKHSTGGVGDKVSLILAPLVAEAGVAVPMISGRGLGHTGGTLDKLESIPGFRTDLSLSRFRDLLLEHRFALIGQTAEIAPADKRLYALRDVTGTVESIPLIASSIMSKKLAEGIDGLVLDVKTGSGAFMSRIEDARALAETMVGIGRAAGKQVVALITDMGEPLGRMVGNALEVAESCDTLRGDGPDDLRTLTVALGAEMLVMAGAAADVAEAEARLGAILNSGAAFARFERLVEAQGGDPRALGDTSLLPQAPAIETVRATRDGVVEDFDCAEVGRAAVVLGAGRATKEDVVDPAVGIEVCVRRGDAVQVGDALFHVHYRERARADVAAARLAAAVEIGDEARRATPLVLERIG
jgi:pyrimidine-nucleoside phosphorylase